MAVALFILIAIPTLVLAAVAVTAAYAASLEKTDPYDRRVFDNAAAYAGGLASVGAFLLVIIALLLF